ncbi:hypothetical protein FOL47_010525 [Perkinsus chesapeaki]|uniref:Uncharacterized protein n=1 Tax=Perkinsus chesapeaki TaxID=330153 RepID=A0A7J6MPH3_PERCH|nr:hypothetical protein FOL47_010525 [Perkinsus chesapeaki]
MSIPSTITAYLTLATCLIVCVIGPWAVDSSKTTILDTFSNGHLVASRAAYPYSIAAFMMGDHLIGTIVAYTAEVLTNRRHHKRGDIISWNDIKLMTPLAVLYTISDLSTLQAIDHGNSPTMSVVSQTRLLLVALLSYYILGHSLDNRASLIGVVVCAIAFTITELPSDGVDASAIPWSVSKALLSSACAVYLEYLIKGDSRGFYATAGRLKLISLLFTFIGLLIINGPANILGDKPQCDTANLAASCLGSEVCDCLEEIGMNFQSWMAFTVIVANGWITAYVFKSVSATAKYICSALAAPILYVLSCAADHRSFEPVPFMLVCLLVLQVVAYCRSTKGSSGKRPRLTKVVSTGDFGEWLQGYRFPDVDEEVIECILADESSNKHVIPLLTEIQDEVHPVAPSLIYNLKPTDTIKEDLLCPYDPQQDRTILAGATFVELEHAHITDTSEASMVLPNGTSVSLLTSPGYGIRIRPPSFGYYTVKVVDKATGEQNLYGFVATTHVSRFGSALDEYQDAWMFAWRSQKSANGSFDPECYGTWNEELAAGVVGVMEIMDDEMWQSEQSLVARLASAQVVPMCRELLDKVLEYQDGTAMGQLVGALRDMLTSAQLTGRSQSWCRFHEAVVAFERARFRSLTKVAQDRLLSLLQQLMDDADLYYTDPTIDDSYGNKWRSGARDQLARQINNRMIDDPLVVSEMASSGGTLGDWMSSMLMVSNRGGIDKPHRIWPPTFMVNPLDPQLDTLLLHGAEAATGGGFAISKGGMMPFLSSMESVETMSNVLSALLYAGIGYAGQTQMESQQQAGPASSMDPSTFGRDALCGVCERARAVCCLDHPPELSKRRVTRLKDVCRLLRQLQRGPDGHRRVSLSVSTDPDVCIGDLKSKKGDECWLSAPLEALWRSWIASGRMFVFEIWLHDSLDESKKTLLACDFGHPVGTSVYIATRYYSDEYKKYQPGFILGFSTCTWLKSLGYSMWDLGGYNSSPMMAYKSALCTLVDGRAKWPPLIRRVRDDRPKGKRALSPSRSSCDVLVAFVAFGPSDTVLVEDLTEEDIWGLYGGKPKAGKGAAKKPKTNTK